MRRVHRGFTLIELLVVVAIIVLLIAIILPSLGRAREQAKTVLCSSNMRGMGQLINLYAGEHDGRGPGGGNDSQGNPIPAPGQPNVGTGVSWDNILNSETLARPSSTKYTGQNYGVAAGHSALPSTKMLSCPNFQPSPGPALYNIPFAYNAWAAGGGNAGGVYYGPYGLAVLPEVPDTVIRSASNPTWTYYKYWYGAKLDRFNPRQFLIIEFDYANSVISYVRVKDSKGGVVLGQGIYWPYTTKDSDLSFRHPYFQRANYLHFDGHVETLKPKDNVGSDRQYYMPGSSGNP